MYEDLSLYIDGEFIPAGNGRDRTSSIRPPARSIGKLPHATRADLDRALAAAQRALPDLAQAPRRWSAASILRKVAELSRAARQRDRPQHHARHGQAAGRGRAARCSRCAEHFDWHAEECRRIYGRVIPPRAAQRAPDGAAASRSASAPPSRRGTSRTTRRSARSPRALGAGCTIIIKGPEDAPSAVVAIARCSTRRAAAGRAQRRLGRAGRGLRVPHQVADRAQDLVHRLGAGRQAARRRSPACT